MHSELEKHRGDLIPPGLAYIGFLKVLGDCCFVQILDNVHNRMINTDKDIMIL